MTTYAITTDGSHYTETNRRTAVALARTLVAKGGAQWSRVRIDGEPGNAPAVAAYERATDGRAVRVNA